VLATFDEVSLGEAQVGIAVGLIHVKSPVVSRKK
jgi:hypothetical protein